MSPPVSIPPSVGGTILAVMSGLMLGRLGAGVAHGPAPSAGAWLVPIGLLAFAVLVLTGIELARRRMGVLATPASLRRQAIVVGGGLLVGVGIGFVLASG